MALTGRSRGVYRKFKLSRIKLRELALEGKVPGMRKGILVNHCVNHQQDADAERGSAGEASGIPSSSAIQVQQFIENTLWHSATPSPTCSTGSATAPATASNPLTVATPKVCAGIAAALKHEGYVNGHDIIDDGRQGILRVELRYGPNGEKLFHKLKRESKPGCRVYTKVDDLPRPLAGLGVAILTTPRGVLSDRQCREKRSAAS